MKYFIAISAVILTVSGLPTDIGNKAFNESSTRSDGLIGFGAGTIGGAGGAVWTVWDAFAFRDAITGDAARFIVIRGRIDLTPLFTGTPGVLLRVGGYKTLYGGDTNAELFGGGLRLSRVSHTIIQNLKFTNCLSYGPGERPNGNGGIINQQPGAYTLIDCIDINNSTLTWIDHCEFSDGPWNAASIPTSQSRHDGLIDIRSGSSLVSVSNNIFSNHNLVSLVGSSDNTGAEDNGRLKVTFYQNWYQGVIQRNPRVRFGEVHVLNNLYTDIRDYGIGIGVAAQVYVERNVFVNTRRGWGFAAGVPNPIGYLYNDNNRLVNSAHDTNVPSNISWRPNQYYSYTPLEPAQVEAYVRNHAGIRI